LFKAPPIYFSVKPDGGIDFRLTTAKPGIFSIFIFLNQLRAEIQFLKSYNPDVVVSDSRLSTIIAALLLGLPVITILNLYRITIPREKRFLRLAKIADGGILTIIGKIWNMSKIIFIPDFPHPNTISINNLGVPSRRRRKIKFVGPILPIKSEDLPERGEILKNIGLDNRPLIFTPISGPLEEKKYFTLMLRRFFKNFPKKYNVIMSLGNPNASKEPIKACDLVISRAGLGTLTQTICYGKPLLVIPTPNHTEQFNNSKRVEELGVAKVIDQKKLSYGTLLSSINEIFSTEQYRKNARTIQKKISDYNGIEKIIEFIINSGVYEKES
jgi:uncharacterized protein (TIGR00661 family)